MSYIEIDLHYDWWEPVYEDFLQILDAAGVSAESNDIHFSGFWSQGDGASFTGNFYLRDVDGDKLRELLPEYHHYYVANPLEELAKEHAKILGKIGRNGLRYSHSNTMVIADYSSDESYCDEHTDKFEGDEDRLLQIFRNLADYLYSQLRTEYEFHLAYQTCAMWDGYTVEVYALKQELQQLRESIIDSLPSAEVQVKALGDRMDHLEDEIELLESKIDQLEDQFHYWKDGKSMTIQEFRNENF